MNKKIKLFCEERGLEVSGNTAYGIMNGYETNFCLQNFDAVSPIKIHLSCFTTDEQRRVIAETLRKKEGRFLHFEFTECGLNIGIGGWTNNSIMNKLPAIIDETCGALTDNGAVGTGFCPRCGNELKPGFYRTYNINGLKISLDSDCADDINNAIEADNADYENAPNNYGKGFLGALIGGVAGMATAVILYLLGSVAAISSLVAFALGTFLYGKFGGKKNNTMIVIVTVTSIVCVMGSILAIYLVVSGLAAKEAGVNLTAFGAFGYLMKTSAEFSRAFYSDLAIMGLFSVIGVVFEVFSARKKISRPQKIK